METCLVYNYQSCSKFVGGSKRKRIFCHSQEPGGQRFCKLGWAPEYESQPILLRTLQRTLQLTLGLARETDQLTEILCV